MVFSRICKILFFFTVLAFYSFFCIPAFPVSHEIIDNNNNTEKYAVVTPEQFGAKGDGITDDADAINRAIEAGNFVLFSKNKKYIITNHVFVLKEGVTIDLNGSTIKSPYEDTIKYILNCSNKEVTYKYDGHGNLLIKNGTLEHLEIGIAHAKNIKILNIDFKNSDGHFIQIMSCSDVLIRNCTFKGIRTFQKDGITPTRWSSCECINLDPCVFSAFRVYGKNSASYDGTNNVRIIIDNCTSEQGNDIGYMAPQRLGFSHYHINSNLYHDRIVVRNNMVYGSEDMCCMQFFDFHNSKIYNNILVTNYTKPIVNKFDFNNFYFNNKVVLLKCD